MTDKEREIFQAATTRWGTVAQMDVAVEELAELIKAILKLRRDGKMTMDQLDLAEEVADVGIMLDQIRVIFPQLEQEWEPMYRESKVRRLEDRLKLQIAEIQAEDTAAAVHTGHFKQVCKGCGAVIMQCRCIGAKPTIRKGYCESCRKKMGAPR